MAVNWDVDNLIDGSTWDEIKSGWLAFSVLIRHTPKRNLLLAMRGLRMDYDAYEVDAWEHPLGPGAIIPRYKGGYYVENLIRWAARNNLRPRKGYAAWELIRDFIEELTNVR